MPPSALRDRKRERTRRALLEAAVELFETRGYEATTVADIAATAEVGTRTFFNYFASKEELLFPEPDERVQAAVRAIATRRPGERPVEVLLRALRAAGDNPGDHLGDTLASRISVLRARISRTVPAVSGRAAYAQLASQQEIARQLRTAFPDELDDVGAAALVGAVVGAVSGALTVLFQQPGLEDGDQLHRKIQETTSKVLAPWLNERPADTGSATRTWPRPATETGDAGATAAHGFDTRGDTAVSTDHDSESEAIGPEAIGSDASAGDGRPRAAGTGGRVVELRDGSPEPRGAVESGESGTEFGKRAAECGDDMPGTRDGAAESGESGTEFGERTAAAGEFGQCRAETAAAAADIPERGPRSREPGGDVRESAAESRDLGAVSSGESAGSREAAGAVRGTVVPAPRSVATPRPEPSGPRHAVRRLSPEPLRRALEAARPLPTERFTVYRAEDGTTRLDTADSPPPESSWHPAEAPSDSTDDLPLPQDALV
ncbi:TetR family transcriptional regulator [Nocardia otitidiscaviarum]|uniref:TetR family transcriptional regulator n=1 Tax=Nocardia otitidiscaviarum TaxID=1823 RepID=UPI002B4AB84B|nr:TetR family transcriptional regulator [Nocardia otitidiscaviarum]